MNILSLWQQRRHLMFGIPTPLFRCGFSYDLPLSISQLRERLRRQQADEAPRMQTMDTEARLVLSLSRSQRKEERAEALERGELLWNELQELSSPIPMSSRTGVRTALCAGMRRCAIVAGRREVAETWTERFAELRNICPEDFTTGAHHTPGEVLGWRRARQQAQFSSGLDGNSLPADEAEDDEEDEAMRMEAKKRLDSQRRVRTPLQQFRHDVFMDHPIMQRAFKRGVEGPGPRYTGD